MPLIHDVLVATDDDAGDSLGIDGVFLLQLLDGLHHGLVRDMRGIGFERQGLNGPGGSEPVEKSVQLRWQRKRIVIAIATLQHGGRAMEALARQERTFETELT